VTAWPFRLDVEPARDHQPADVRNVVVTAGVGIDEYHAGTLVLGLSETRLLVAILTGQVGPDIGAPAKAPVTSAWDEAVMA
jgi:hypothetical protein